MKRTRVRLSQITGLDGLNTLEERLRQLEVLKPSVTTESNLPTQAIPNERRVVEATGAEYRFDDAKKQWVPMSDAAKVIHDTKLDKLAGYTFIHTLSQPTLNYSLPPVEVLRLHSASGIQVKDVHQFNNTDSVDFQSNPYIVFDGMMKLQTNYNRPFVAGDVLSGGNLFEYEIDMAEFKDLSDFVAGDSLSFKGLPQGQSIIPTKSISIKSMKSIQSGALTSSVTGSGAVKIAVSIDGHLSWKTFDGTGWVSLTTAEFGTKGMTPTVFNGVTATQWSSLFGTAALEQIAFGYYLDQTNFTDTASNDKIGLTAEMYGSYRKAVHVTDYDYEYISPYEIKFYVNANGTYKFNVSE